MGHSLNRTSFRINQNLVIDDKTFNPGYILVSDIYGNASWQNPNQYISNEEPLDHFIGELYGGGIVVAVWREQRETLYEICLIASVKNYSEYEWQNGSNFWWRWTNNALSIGTASRYNAFGASNSSAIVVSDTSGLGAAAKCLGYTNEDLYGLGIYGDWYLPSTFEINCLANNAGLVDRVISQYSVDKSINIVDASDFYDDMAKMSLFENNNSQGYWTSTEYNVGSAHFLNMGVAGGVRFGTASKSSYKYVRPFRQDVKRWNGITWVQDRNKTGKVLITYETYYPTNGPMIVTNITASELSLGNTTTVLTYSALPADLSEYDHIWDIGLSDGTQPLLPAAKFTTYLQQGGGLFILGEHAGFNTRNGDLASFITGLGGGNIQTSNDYCNSNLIVESEFLIANNRSTWQPPTSGRFSSIGTGTPITRDLNVNPTFGTTGTTGHAVVWKTGSLSLAPKGAIVVVLEINFLSDYYAPGSSYTDQANNNVLTTCYSVEFVANISKILNKS